MPVHQPHCPLDKDAPTETPNVTTAVHTDQQPSLEWSESSRIEGTTTASMQDSKASEGTPEAIAEFRRLQEHGQVFYEEERFDAALQVWQQATELASAAGWTCTEKYESSVPTILEQQKIRGSIATCLLKMGQADKAGEEARRCIAMDDTWIKGHVRLAEALRQKGDVLEAMHAIDVAIHMEPDNASANQLADKLLQDYEGGRASPSSSRTDCEHPNKTSGDPSRKAAATHSQRIEIFALNHIADVWVCVNSVTWLAWRVVMCIFLVLAMIFAVTSQIPSLGTGVRHQDTLFNWCWRKLQEEKSVQLPIALETLRDLWRRVGKALLVMAVWCLFRQVQKTYANPCILIAGDPYQVLGVHPLASKSDITQAYRELSKKCHPDKEKAKGVASDVANERFAIINDARDSLADPIARGVYDGCGRAGLDMMKRFRLDANNRPPNEDLPRFVCQAVQGLEELEVACGKEAVRLVLEKGMEPNEACNLLYVRQHHSEWGL
jgi:tetratricopeptide (TPR) repeat protein